MDTSLGGVHRLAGRGRRDGGDARHRRFTGLDGGRLHRNRRARAGELARVRAQARSLRQDALRLADRDASASRAFGAAFRLEPGTERDAAISRASIDAARASAVLGRRAIVAVGDLAWLAAHGNRALVADVAVAFGALRAAVAGARTNVSFDLAALTSGGSTLEEVHEGHPDLWSIVGELNGAVDRIDCLTAQLDHRAAPTEEPG